MLNNNCNTDFTIWYDSLLGIVIFHFLCRLFYTFLPRLDLGQCWHQQTGPLQNKPSQQPALYSFTFKEESVCHLLVLWMLCQIKLNLLFVHHLYLNASSEMYIWNKQIHICLPFTFRQVVKIQTVIMAVIFIKASKCIYQYKQYS
jgi:hypothetical protein